MASIEKRTREGQSRWYAQNRDPSGKQRTRTFDRKIDAERFVTKTEASKLTGSITWRVYSYLMASDEDAGRAARAKTLSRVVPDVYPMCTGALGQ